MNILAYLLEKYPNKNWKWENISGNINLTMDIIEKYPNKDWSLGGFGISCNPNITMDFIENNKDKICFNVLSYNDFNNTNN